MSGHSKWSTIKRKKGIKDQQRGKLFSKLSRLITIAISEGGGITDPGKNIQLRLALSQARAVNMPKDTIERAITKAVGDEGEKLSEALYEAFGPAGSAFLISVTTDNPNRSHAELKYMLEKHGGKIGGANSASYLFEKCGLLVIQRSRMSESEAFSLFDRVEGLDFEEDEKHYYIFVPFEKLGIIQQGLDTDAFIEIEAIYKPKITIFVDSKLYVRLEQLVEVLEELDDVQKVYGNYSCV